MVMMGIAIIDLAFVEFEGSVHLVSPSNGSQHTLCAVAENAADLEQMEQLRWRKTSKRIVDCPTCATMILACRMAHVSSGLS